MEADRIRTQLDRILASSTFADAERARRFLRFVVELALAGRNDEIKESVVAVEVLGRAASFDPRMDPIVRVEAGRLRTRLSSYYQSEGTSDPVIIDLPKGGYVPHFEERPSSQPATMPRPKSARRQALIAVSAALSGVLAFWAISSYSHSAPPLPEPVRLSVLPPEGSELKNMTISPDGRYLAFTATSEKVTRLWIRKLESLDARALPGTEGAAFPFWSPDSQSVAFFSFPQLRKIRAAGGPSQAICATDAGFGGTWGSQGVIVFGQRPGGTLFQVPAAGGTPKPVTTLDRAHGEIVQFSPYFLPDGRHFLYSAVNRMPTVSSVRVSSLDSHDAKLVVNADVGAVYAPPYAGHAGSLLFSYHGALMSQPFDTERLELSGAASQIAPNVRHLGRTEVSVSSNGVIAYQGNSEKDRQLTWFDRNGREIGTAGSRNDYNNVSLSPDEKRLAIEACDPYSGRCEIWIMDLQRGSLSRIGTQAEEGFAPVWSPDGSEIVFSAESSSLITLMRQAVDKPNAVPFLGLGGVVVSSDWSADGKFVAYTRLQVEGGIWVKPTGGNTGDRGRWYSRADHECCAAFSPILSVEGPRWMAYTSDETGQNEVYVKTFPAGDRKWQVSNGGGWQPQWRQDGREIFYLALDGKLMASDVVAGPNFASGAPQTLFDTTSLPSPAPKLPEKTYAVDKAGQRFLVNCALRKSAPGSITILLPSR